MSVEGWENSCVPTETGRRLIWRKDLYLHKFEGLHGLLIVGVHHPDGEGHSVVESRGGTVSTQAI